MFDIDKIGSTGKTETQPTFPELVADIKSKKKNVTTNNLPTDDKKTEFNLSPGSLPTKPRTNLSKTKFDNVNVTDENIDYIKDGKVVKKLTEEDVETIKADNSSIESAAKTKGISKNLFSKAKGKSAGITKEDMQDNTDPNVDYTPLRKWYYGKTDLQLKTIAENLAFSNWMLKDFIADFENTNERNNLAEYIERLNKCY